MRNTYILGNWKMNHGPLEIQEFIESFEPQTTNAYVGIAPQFIHLPILLKSFPPKGINLGAQNCGAAVSGAHTGEVSAKNLKELGTDFVLIAHSERRALYKETNELFTEKIKQAIENNLKVIYCIGETLEQREADQMFDVLRAQLSVLKPFQHHQEDIVVAYEPVWAIGTGKTATPEQANEAHSYIRNELNESLGFNGNSTSILYGGSVKPANAKELLSQEHIDGALIGGASLKAEAFQAIISKVS